MTTHMQPKQLLLFILSAYLFLGCSKHESVTTVQSVETLEQPVTIVSKATIPTQTVATTTTSSSTEANYGEHQEEIESILSTAPVGSEIYLEQKDDGAWYLKIEKTFTAQKAEEKKDEPLYGETILI